MSWNNIQTIIICILLITMVVIAEAAAAAVTDDLVAVVLAVLLLLFALEADVAPPVETIVAASSVDAVNEMEWVNPGVAVVLLVAEL
jgi:hypothetical protein